jgi:guanylate kinase
MSSEEAHRPRRGVMVVLSSPSGAGKSTLARMLLEAEPEIVLSVSATTRPARAEEKDGRDYRFVGRAAFEAMAAAGDFLEWAEVFGNLYGTPRAPVEAALAAGRDVLFDVDWQGARALKTAAPQDVVGVFILPPSLGELEGRLRRRAQDDEAVIAKRMAKSADEISHWTEYDYVLVNDHVGESFARLRQVLAAERLRRLRQPWLERFVAGLVS